MEEVKRFPVTAIMYTTALALVTSLYYGFRNNANFLGGNTEQIFYDFGGVVGGFLFPFLVAFPIAVPLYFWFRKKGHKFFSIVTYAAAVIVTVLALNIYQLLGVIDVTTANAEPSALNLNKVVDFDDYSCADYMKFSVMEGSSLIMFELFYFAGEHRISKIDLGGDTPARIGALIGGECAMPENADASLKEIFKSHEAQIVKLIRKSE